MGLTKAVNILSGQDIPDHLWDRVENYQKNNLLDHLDRLEKNDLYLENKKLIENLEQSIVFEENKS